jgi:hypothetical protein
VNPSTCRLDLLQHRHTLLDRKIHRLRGKLLAVLGPSLPKKKTSRQNGPIPSWRLTRTARRPGVAQRAVFAPSAVQGTVCNSFVASGRPRRPISTFAADSQREVAADSASKAHPQHETVTTTRSNRMARAPPRYFGRHAVRAGSYCDGVVDRSAPSVVHDGTERTQRTRPRNRVAIIVRLVLKAPDEPNHVNVAGGPLEEHLGKRGARLVSRTEHLTPVRREHQYALRDGWLLNDYSPVAARLEALGCQRLIAEELERKLSS